MFQQSRGIACLPRWIEKLCLHFIGLPGACTLTQGGIGFPELPFHPNDNIHNVMKLFSSCCCSSSAMDLNSRNVLCVGLMSYCGSRKTAKEDGAAWRPPTPPRPGTKKRDGDEMLSWCDAGGCGIRNDDGNATIWMEIVDEIAKLWIGIKFRLHKFHWNSICIFKRYIWGPENCFLLPMKSDESAKV